ncbi:hypothetical protein [Amycolatopsis keratiniphila]|uniref:Uncharacterized protein n=1 Tax=Amycolatopsis keratiniphila subsp. keratiniphila TaxID=227715 RepID=A0A1W2LHH5_9PSEU|nr:hypothetical protein [Amycolatopsis keratiniphila]ONF62311.1 hypothetical protein AVR91_0238775 [Amycolatopsis keratiniphila subsp. keratiniphila]
MKIRIEGTAQETAAGADLLREVFNVREVSTFYPNRGRSTLGRVYVDVEFAQPGPVRATATRVEQLDKRIATTQPRRLR